MRILDLRCRIGWHKKRLRTGDVADHTYMVTGVNLYECTRCPWHMKGIHEE